jgi:hypothetical protein
LFSITGRREKTKKNKEREREREREKQTREKKKKKKKSDAIQMVLLMQFRCISKPSRKKPSRISPFFVVHVPKHFMNVGEG